MPACRSDLAAAMPGNSAPGGAAHFLCWGNTPAITALAVLTPQLPTVAELGLKSLEREVLYVVMAPVATSGAVVQVLERNITLALQRPEVQERLNNLEVLYEGITGAAAKRQTGMTAH